MTQIKPTSAQNSAQISASDQVVETSLKKLTNLATLPQSALEIMRLEADADSGAEALEQVIQKDPALSARVLKVTNSSFYGLSRTVDSVRHAVVMLGLGAVKNIAIAGSVQKVFQADRMGRHFDPSELWEHSVAVATGTREIAKRIGFGSPDEAFLAGLIHDVGIMVEMQVCRPKFIEMLEQFFGEPRLSFRGAETQVLGATHEAFGAGLCRKWKFPLQLEHVAGYHHRPLQLSEQDRLLPAIVHVADIIAVRLGIGYTGTVESPVVDPAVLQFLKLDEGDLESVEDSLTDAITEATQFLSGN